MGRIYSDRQLGLGVQPTPENTAARKDERVCAVVTDDGQFQIAVERCGVYWLPFHSSIIGSAKPSALIQISPYGRISDVPAVKREAEEDWGLRLKSCVMALNSRNDPQYWRNRADEARAIAVQMTDPHTKATMLAIAKDYDKLAVRAEHRAAKTSLD